MGSERPRNSVPPENVPPDSVPAEIEELRKKFAQTRETRRVNGSLNTEPGSLSDFFETQISDDFPPKNETENSDVFVDLDSKEVKISDFKTIVFETQSGNSYSLKKRTDGDYDLHNYNLTSTGKETTVIVGAHLFFACDQIFKFGNSSQTSKVISAKGIRC